MDSSVCVGIDVSQQRLDVAVHPSGESWHCRTTVDELSVLCERLRSVGPRVVSFEASGGYERPLADALTGARLPFAIVNPRNVRNYARAVGCLAKTDRIDAVVIARFAYATDLKPKPPLSAVEREVRDLVAHRARLVADRARQKNRSKHGSGVGLASVERYVAFLTQEIRMFDEELKRVIMADTWLRQRWERLLSVPGIGETLAAVLVGGLPELGRLSRGAVAALAGMAPLARDSGKREGKRFCWGGRTAIGPALYMPMLAAIQHNSDMRVLYQRLVERGKPRKVALTACMRKMLTILNAILRNETVWNPNSA